MLVDWNRLVLQNIIRPLRDVRVFSVVRSAMAFVVLLHNEFLKYKKAILYRLNHNWQVRSIEDVLNDSYDIDLRRIYIEDSGGWKVQLLNTDADGDAPIVNLDVDGNALLIQNDAAYDDGEYDFIIVLPFELSIEDKYRLRALVDVYRLAGTRCDILVKI